MFNLLCCVSDSVSFYFACNIEALSSVRAHGHGAKDRPRKQKTPQNGTKCLLRCGMHGSTQNFNSFSRCNGRSRCAISCARLASGTYTPPNRKDFHQMPFSLAAENAKLILLRCFKNMISFFFHLVKHENEILFYQFTVFRYLCKIHIKKA